MILQNGIHKIEIPIEFFNLWIFTFSNVSAFGNYKSNYALLIFYTLLRMSLRVFFSSSDIRFCKSIKIRVWGRRTMQKKKNLQVVYTPYLNFSTFFDSFVLLQIHDIMKQNSYNVNIFCQWFLFKQGNK